MNIKDWEKDWKELVKVNFDGLNGLAYGKGETEMKVELLGLVFIKDLLSQSNQENIKK